MSYRENNMKLIQTSKRDEGNIVDIASQHKRKGYTGGSICYRNQQDTVLARAALLTTKFNDKVAFCEADRHNYIVISTKSSADEFAIRHRVDELRPLIFPG